MQVDFGNGVIELSATDPKAVDPKKWYYGFDCASCGKRFAVTEDPSFGTQNFQMTGEAKAAVPCPHCGSAHQYVARTMESRRGT